MTLQCGESSEVSESQKDDSFRIVIRSNRLGRVVRILNVDLGINLVSFWGS